MTESSADEKTARDTSETVLTADPGEQEIVITRTFDAPRERVFEAITDANQIPKWWGPSRYTTTVDEMDVRPGGRWRFRNHDADGTDYAFRGVYHDVVAPEYLAQTFEYEGAPRRVSLESAAFEDEGGKTRLTIRSTFQAVEDRDAMVAEGMEEGARETWERFAALVETRETEAGR